jgi:hypothetical protein
MQEQGLEPATFGTPPRLSYSSAMQIPVMIPVFFYIIFNTHFVNKFLLQILLIIFNRYLKRTKFCTRNRFSLLQSFT